MLLPMMLRRSRSCSTLALCLFAATATAGWAQQQQQPTLEIVEAIYGAGAFQMNVTQLVRGMVRNNTLDVAADPAVLGGDPAPGQAKRLRLVYRVNGRQMEAAANDFERVRLPLPAAVPATTQQQQQQQQGGNWAAGAVPNATQPAAPAKPGGFSIGDILGNPAAASGGNQAMLRIVAARYGAESRFNDVRERLQAMVSGEALSVKVDNAAMGGDPAVARSKTLEVTYEYRGATYQVAAKEGATLTLPDASARAVSSAPAAPLPAVAPAASPLRIVAARYGSGDRFNDVRDRLQGLVRDNALSVKVDNAAMGGDPAVGKDKSLEVTYELNGATYRTAAREGKTLNLPDTAAQVVSTPAAVTAPVAAAPSSQSRGADVGASRSAGNRNIAAPVASSGSVAPVGTAGGLRIFYARYAAADGREADIRERLRPLLQNDSLRVTVGAEAFGDPAPGAAKVATILYEYKGRTYEKSGRDGEVIQLP